MVRYGTVWHGVGSTVRFDQQDEAKRSETIGMKETPKQVNVKEEKKGLGELGDIAILSRSGRLR